MLVVGFLRLIVEEGGFYRFCCLSRYFQSDWSEKEKESKINGAC